MYDKTRFEKHNIAEQLKQLSLSMLQIFSSIFSKIPPERQQNIDKDKFNTLLLKWIDVVQDRFVSQKIYAKIGNFYEYSSDQSQFEIEGKNYVYYTQYQKVTNSQKVEIQLKNILLKNIQASTIAEDFPDFSLDDLQNLILEVLELKIEKLDPLNNQLTRLDANILEEEVYRELKPYQNDMSKLVLAIDSILERKQNTQDATLNENHYLLIEQLNFLKSNAQTLETGKPRSFLDEAKTNLNSFFDEQISTNAQDKIIGEIKQLDKNISHLRDNLDLKLVELGLNLESIKQINTILGFK